MSKLDDGQRMRRLHPRRTLAVETCLSRYQEIRQCMDTGRAFYLLHCELAARIAILSLPEQKAYYTQLKTWRAEGKG